MYENTVGHVEQEEMDCEALFVIREAEDLEEMTLAYHDINASDTEMASVFPDPPDEDSHIECAWGMDFCVAQVEKAARAVVEETRRLEFMVEHYTEQLQNSVARDGEESPPAPEDSSSTSNGGELVLEARAIVSEVERLQERVLRLFACVEESTLEDKSDND